MRAPRRDVLPFVATRGRPGAKGRAIMSQTNGSTGDRAPASKAAAAPARVAPAIPSDPDILRIQLREADRYLEAMRSIVRGLRALGRSPNPSGWDAIHRR